MRRSRLLAAVLAVLAAAATALAVPSAASAITTEKIVRHPSTGKCLDSSAFGIATCNGARRQVWQIETFGTLFLVRSKQTGKCIVRQGTGFTYATCDSGNSAHLWNDSTTGLGTVTINQPGNVCWQATTGTLQLRTCQLPFVPEQQWTAEDA